MLQRTQEPSTATQYTLLCTDKPMSSIMLKYRRYISVQRQHVEGINEILLVVMDNMGAVIRLSNVTMARNDTKELFELIYVGL